MSNLLSILGLGASGIAAHNAGVGVAGNNVANVNTPGYSRQRVDLRSQPGVSAVLPGGVRVESTQRYANDLLAYRSRTAAGSFGLSNALYHAMLDLEHLVSAAGPGIEQAIAAFSSKLGEVAAAPLDHNLRDAAIAAARDLAANIRRRAESIVGSQEDADARIIANASVANTLATQLADANRSIAMVDDPALRDRRDQLANELSGLIGGQARIDPDGHLRFVLDSGAVVVDGIHAAAVESSADPTTGFARIEIVSNGQRRDVTASLRGGQVGGDLMFRDEAATQTAAELDTLAADIGNAYNSVHSVGAGLDGVSGRALFSFTAGPGAARSFVVDAAVSGDSDALASRAVGAGPGDNSVALALNQVAGRRLASGGTRTITDAAIDLAAGVGRVAADAAAAHRRDTVVREHLAGLRDSFAGVDLDEEMTQLARFQHAAEAMTRVVSTVDTLLGDLIARL